ncbi:MAG: MaoC family dehydratase [Chloroflexota bacterium]|nr:MaoC family dehydratase [Chloroflexota bacterium]
MFDRFAALSGDDNPIHVDPAFSARTRFGRTVAHGMLLYSSIWGLLKRHFPELSHEEQTLMFPAPTFAGEEITVRLEVLEIDPKMNRARLETRIIKANGEDGCRGETVVGWPDSQ